MRKLLLNECHVTLELRLPPDSRMLVAESRPERRGAEEREVTVAVQENGRPYLPGSSLKGVFRNRAEYIGNVIKRNGVGACHLFSGPLPEQGSSADVRLSCGERFRVRINAADRRQHELSAGAIPGCMPHLPAFRTYLLGRSHPVYRFCYPRSS